MIYNRTAKHDNDYRDEEALKWAIIGKFGAQLKRKPTTNRETIKMGTMEIEQSFIFKYYKSIYSVLTEDNCIRYYRNKTDYYFNKQIMGFIYISNHYNNRTVVKKLNNDKLTIKTSNDKIWKLKYGNQEIRDEWFDVISKICFNYNVLSDLIANG
eukprot:335418_1